MAGNLGIFSGQQGGTLEGNGHASENFVYEEPANEGDTPGPAFPNLRVEADGDP
jgi:hypothetical protein